MSTCDEPEMDREPDTRYMCPCGFETTDERVFYGSHREWCADFPHETPRDYDRTCLKHGCGYWSFQWCPECAKEQQGWLARVLWGLPVVAPREEMVRVEPMTTDTRETVVLDDAAVRTALLKAIEILNKRGNLYTGNLSQIRRAGCREAARAVEEALKLFNEAEGLVR